MWSRLLLRSPLEMDGPPHPMFDPSVETVDITHIPRGYERFCDSRLEGFWGHQGRLPSRSESSWREQVGFCGDEGRGWGAGSGWGLHVLNFQLAPKEEAPSLSDELAQMWGRRKRESDAPWKLPANIKNGVRFFIALCSKYCTGHTDARFICLKFIFNWESCVFIVAVTSGNRIYRAEKGKSLAPSWDCSVATPTLSHYFQTSCSLRQMNPYVFKPRLVRSSPTWGQAHS